MDNSYLFDASRKVTEWRKRNVALHKSSAPPEWTPSKSLAKASALRELRNIALHKGSESKDKVMEAIKSWAN